jgi:hypothetical protein
MNANSIWPDHEYAFAVDRPNKSFPINATKGKCIRVFQQREYGNERKSSYVVFEVMNGDGVPHERTIRSRDVVDFWDDYENERKHILAEREEKHRIATALAEQREREYQERRRLDAIEAERAAREREAAAQRERLRKEQIVLALENRIGFPREYITVGTHHVELGRAELEKWLGDALRD